MTPNRLLAPMIAMTISSISSLYAQDTPTLPSWVSADGRSIQAKFLKIDGEALVVEKDGKEVTIPFAKLSAASVDLAKKFGGDKGQLKPPVSIVPSQFEGKTFEECEKLLGSATAIEEPGKQAVIAFSRTYVSPIPGILKIQLLRGPVGGEDGPIPPTVNIVRYYFPKGKSWQEALVLVGLDKDSIAIRANEKTYISFWDKNQKEVMWIFSNSDYDQFTF